MGSESFGLNYGDFYKIGKGALLAAAGAAGSYLLQVGVPTKLDKQEWLVLGAALGSVALNAAYKFLTDTTS